MTTVKPLDCVAGNIPFVQYGVSFPNKTLPLEGTSVTGGATGALGTTGVTEILDENIKWEPHVGEADKLDYIVAVSSGVIAGLIDVFYVGELSFERASEWGEKQVNQLVMKVARLEGYQGDDLHAAIKTLEDEHYFAADGNTNDFGGGRQHHLRDFSHHFSIGGLLFSIFTQFTGLVVGTDTHGVLQIVPVPDTHRKYLGSNFQEKIAFGTIGWFFHVISDMAGSSGSTTGGTGVPGPLVSFMKELSVLPFFQNLHIGEIGFRAWISKLFNGTLLAEHDENGKIIKESVRRFDLRTEIGLLGEIGCQAIPVLINQCVVRGFYFCRRVCREIRNLDIQKISDLIRIAPEDILPWGTPAMRRMATVSSGVFAGVDIADAAVRAIAKKDPVTFLLHVNYVGVATFVIACVVDARATLEDRDAEKEDSPEKAYEKKLADFGCLELDFAQARILHSIEHAIVSHDIAQEKHPKCAARKEKWLKEWSGKIVETVSLVWAADAGYFLDDAALYRAIAACRKSHASESWLWLIALECARFKPYAPLCGDNDKLYKGLKLEANYLDDVFCKQQDIVGKKELQKLVSSIKSTSDELDGGTKKRVLGAAGTLVLVVGTGALAFYFAPAVAPVLAAALGAPTASLSGAALTSASLAFLGGGALAAGGAGMAGGTMFIACGGALLGAMGGSSVSAVTSMALATNGSYVLDECAKLVSFCEEVLIKQYGDFASAAKIHNALNRRIVELEVEIEAIKRNVAQDQIPEDEDDDVDTAKEISPKRMIKVMNRSRRYLVRSRDRLSKALSTSDLFPWYPGCRGEEERCPAGTGHV